LSAWVIQFFRTKTMHRRQFIRLLSTKAAISLGFGLVGCVYYEDYPQEQIYSYPSSYYDYYYYPDVNVYFHIHTGYFYHQDGGAWRRSRSLPRHIHLSRRHRRRVSIRGQRPYDRNREHRRRYPRSDGDRRTRRGGETPEGRRVPEVEPRRDDGRREEGRPRTRVEPRSGQDGPRPLAPREERREAQRGESGVGTGRRTRPERRERAREAEEAKRLRQQDRQEREAIEEESWIHRRRQTRD